MPSAFFITYFIRFKFLIRVMLRLLLVLILLNVLAQAQPKIKWPHGKKAVIVLTYDDALQSQLDVALPQLKAAHLTGTFFLTGDIDYKTIPKWRAAARSGFELGNHTIFHPCTSKEDNPVHSEGYTLEQIIDEIDIMNHFLFAVDGKTIRTYAYPCAETTVGHGQDYADSLGDEDLVKYARIGGDENSVITDFEHLNPVKVPSYGVDDNTTGKQLINFVKKVQQQGGMGIFMFHGISGDYITISKSAHEELLKYLRQNKKEIWVTTFLEAMNYVTKTNKIHKVQALAMRP